MLDEEEEGSEGTSKTPALPKINLDDYSALPEDSPEEEDWKQQAHDEDDEDFGLQEDIDVDVGCTRQLFA